MESPRHFLPYPFLVSALADGPGGDAYLRHLRGAPCERGCLHAARGHHTCSAMCRHVHRRGAPCRRGCAFVQGADSSGPLRDVFVCVGSGSVHVCGSARTRCELALDDPETDQVVCWASGRAWPRDFINNEPDVAFYTRREGFFAVDAPGPARPGGRPGPLEATIPTRARRRGSAKRPSIFNVRAAGPLSRSDFNLAVASDAAEELNSQKARELQRLHSIFFGIYSTVLSSPHRNSSDREAARRLCATFAVDPGKGAHESALALARADRTCRVLSLGPACMGTGPLPRRPVPAEILDRAVQEATRAFVAIQTLPDSARLVYNPVVHAYAFLYARADGVPGRIRPWPMLREHLPPINFLGACMASMPPSDQVSQRSITTALKVLRCLVRSAGPRTSFLQ